MGIVRPSYELACRDSFKGTCDSAPISREFSSSLEYDVANLSSCSLSYGSRDLPPTPKEVLHPRFPTWRVHIRRFRGLVLSLAHQLGAIALHCKCYVVLGIVLNHFRRKR